MRALGLVVWSRGMGVNGSLMHVGVSLAVSRVVFSLPLLCQVQARTERSHRRTKLGDGLNSSVVDK